MLLAEGEVQLVEKLPIPGGQFHSGIVDDGQFLGGMETEIAAFGEGLSERGATWRRRD